MENVEINTLETLDKSARKIAFTIAKGGQLKTTSVVNLAGAILKDETLNSARICIIDLDPQGNVWQTFGLNADKLEKGQDLSRALLHNDISNCIFELYKIDDERFIHSITANDQCDLLEMLIASKSEELGNIIDLLNRVVKQIENKYDYILFDTAPAYSVMISNLLSVEDIEIFVPFEPDYYAVRSVSKSIKSFDVFSQKNPTAKFGGVLATKVKSRTNVHQGLIFQTSSYIETLGKRFLKVQIPSSLKNSNSILNKALPSTLSTRKSDVVVEYFELWEEIKNDIK